MNIVNKLVILVLCLCISIQLVNALPVTYNPYTTKLDFYGVMPINCSSGQALQGIRTNQSVICVDIGTPLSNIMGGGTANYIPMFNESNRINNSPIYVDGRKVGIGTIVPNATLSVGGGGYGNYSGFPTLIDILLNDVYSWGVTYRSNAWNNGNNGWGWFLYGDGTLAFGAWVENITYIEPFHLYNNSGISIGEYVVSVPTNGLVVSGNVGIGIEAPTQKLHVVGNGNFSGTTARVWVNNSIVCTPANGQCNSSSGITLAQLDNNTIIRENNKTWISTAVGNWSADKPNYLLTASLDNTTVLRTDKLVNSTIIRVETLDNGTIIRNNNMSGSSGYIARFNTTGSLNNSIMYENLLGIGVGTIYPSGVLDISNGIIDASSNRGTVNIDGSLNTPFLRIGIGHNVLLQTEVFGTSWTATNTTALTADLATSPIGTKIAEYTVGGGFGSSVSQAVTNATTGNWTFSVWLRSENTSTAQVFLGININRSDAGTPETINLTNAWKRYSVTREITVVHTNLTANITVGTNNVSMWGAQLEQKARPTPYQVARTTTGNNADATIFYTPIAISSSAGLSGTTGSFTSTITHASTMTGTVPTLYISTSGYNLLPAAATAVAPYNLAPRIRFAADAWNNVSNSYQYWKMEVTPRRSAVDGTNVSSEFSLSYSNNNESDTGYKKKLAIDEDGTLTILNTAEGSNVFSNGNFTNAINWTNTSGWTITGGKAVYLRPGVSTECLLTQNLINMSAPLKANTWYRFKYNTSTVNAGAHAYIGTEAARDRIQLKGVTVATVIGDWAEEFQTNSNPINFTIHAYSPTAADGFSLDTLELVEISKGKIDVGKITGGGADGIQVDVAGNVTINNLTSALGGYVCAGPSGNLYVNTTCP